ncbi:MAG: TlpA family protein disulfide reductase [Acidobacteriota bacterium]|nr:MAG: TlpA family protein disulfide reductase [Acidobacteriota bacterium]
MSARGNTKELSAVRICPLVALFLCLAIASAHAQSSPWLPEEERIKVDLSGTFETVTGERIRLNDLTGKVVFLNFWATWCGPCRAEMPSISDLHESLSRKGLEIIAVSDEHPDIVGQFLERSPYPFRVLVDTEAQLAARLRIGSIPWTLIFDKNGKLVHFHQGARLWNTPDIKANVLALLSE